MGGDWMAAYLAQFCNCMWQVVKRQARPRPNFGDWQPLVQCQCCFGTRFRDCKCIFPWSFLTFAFDAMRCTCDSALTSLLALPIHTKTFCFFSLRLQWIRLRANHGNVYPAGRVQVHLLAVLVAP